MPFYSLFNPISPNKRTADTRARSPIKLLDLVMKTETSALKYQLTHGPTITPAEVTELFDKAFENSNVHAIFALAEHYPDIVNPVSVSLKLESPIGNKELLLKNLTSEKEKAPKSLSALYNDEPQQDVTKLFCPNQQQNIERLMQHIEAPTKFILTNGEYDDFAIAEFSVTPNAESSPTPDTRQAPQILAKNENAKAMLPDLERWFKTKRQINFNLPNYVQDSDSAKSNKI
jgi:hypothetical protein